MNELEEVIRVDLPSDGQVYTHGFPDRYYHARFQANKGQWETMIEQLKLRRDANADLGWPTAEDPVERWQPSTSASQIYSNRDRIDPTKGDPLIEAVFDPGNSEVLLQVTYEY